MKIAYVGSVLVVNESVSILAGCELVNKGSMFGYNIGYGLFEQKKTFNMPLCGTGMKFYTGKW